MTNTQHTTITTATTTMKITNEQMMALRSAVDLLSGAYTPELAKELLDDYKINKSRGHVAQSLYPVLDRIERTKEV